MKILELPVATTINCTCGCKFEFDAHDVIYNETYYGSCIMTALSVRCPFCNKEHLLKTIQPNNTNVPWY